MSAAMEDLLRGHLQRQRQIHQRSLKAVADMASANSEMILMNGLDAVMSRKEARAVLSGGQDDGQGDGVDGEVVG